MHLTLCLPGLIWPHAAATGQVPKNLPTQAIDEWLRFGNIQPCQRERSDLYRQIQSYTSLLQHCQQQAGLADAPHVFFASPVLQRVDMHSMSVSDGSNLNLTMSEAQAMCQDINAFMDDDLFHFVPQREYLWLVTSSAAIEWHLPPVCDIEGQLKFMPRPQSDNRKASAKLQTLQAELQMFLSQHPVNQQRRSNKQAEINGIWFWRDLASDTPLDANIPLLTDAPLLQQSANTQTDAPYDWSAAAAWLQEQGRPEQAILWLNPLEAPSMFGDIWGYQDAFQALNERFLQPIQQALKRGELQSLTIKTDGETGFDLHFQTKQRWAFWKRGHHFNHYLQASDTE
ncbi:MULTISPECIES: hypothetical protein [Vitreoscilla]|uniref:Cofactor-independent phosphoglycerate mutase n=1 Tax=Vitreoscilla stercoraria TaxID=61 RepID=A0ABY4EAI2_VITST|nr:MULTISPECIES: hypothetical protein [Vitreoscilla]AUZ06414.1 hypothetical protein ADP71_32450 [Vitreoscilla sp. C1]UOO92301.1 hypothetical protein LVJ81_11910 [Vitreoscilla stercoraria]